MTSYDQLETPVIMKHAPRCITILTLATFWIALDASPASAADKRSVEIQPDLPSRNRITNPSFEGDFRDGVAEGWKTFEIRRGGYFKENAKLGPIGGGIYGARTRDDATGDWIADVRTIRLAGKVNLVDVAREDVVKKLRDALGDDVITVAKYNVEAWFQQKGQEVLKGDPAAQGRQFADYCREKAVKNGYQAHCYYGVNEPHVNSREDLVKICAFEKAFTQRLHQHGMRSIVLNHSTGTPGDRTNMLIEPVRDLLAVADYVGYHCYGGPKDELMCAPSSTPNSMRWRTFARWYHERGWRFPPLIYTEATTWGGWHDQFTPEAIRDDILCMCDRMTDEPWSIGMCLFCTGCWKGQIWSKWDVSPFPEIIEQLREYNVSHPVDARTGTKSQQFGTKDKPFSGGLVQDFESHPKSNMLLTAWLRYEFYDGWPHRLKLHVGIDRTGQTTKPRAASIEWSDELIAAHKWDSDMWYRYSVDFGPTHERSSVWFKATQGAGPSVRVSLDDVCVIETP